MTNRQIFYRLVGAHGYEKTEQAYARLCGNLSRARRARLIPFSAIRDDGTQVSGAPGWSGGPDAFFDAVRSWAQNYECNIGDDQPVHVEVWVEASGMLPQAATVAHEYGVDVYSAGGFNGLTDKFETARRLANEGARRPTVVLHLGDYDPSGCSIIDSLAEDVGEFVPEIVHYANAPEFKRVLVTPEQIERYDPPTAPQKSADRRGEYMANTVQAEALPPDVLAAELREAIEAVVDLEQIELTRAASEEQRDEILARLDTLAS